MKRGITTVIALALAAGAAGVRAQEAPQRPAPGKEHAWLQQWTGEWELESEITLEPGKPPQKGRGTESVRSLGPYWTVAEGKGTFLDAPATGLRTLGYDPLKKKYVATSLHSMDSHLWTYEGTLDGAGKVLTLEAMGPKPGTPGELTRYRDVVEFWSRDHRVLTTSVLHEGGQWLPFVTVHARRKK